MFVRRDASIWVRVLAVLVFMLAVSPAFAQEDDEPDQPPPPADEPAPPPPDDKPDEPPPAAADDPPDDPADPPGQPAEPDDGQPPAADDDQPPAAPAAGGTDTDGDGTPDAPAVDGDTDGDGDSDAPPSAEDLAAAASDAEDGIIGDDADVDGDGQPDIADTDDDNDGVPDWAEDDAQDVAEQRDEDGELYIEADSDGDGKVSAEELAEEQEFDTAFADIPDVINDDALDARPAGKNLLPSLTIEQFRTLVRLAKRKVLERMEVKIKKKADARMETISMVIFLFSLAGFLLLAMPLFLARKYPGQGGNLFKYSAIAAGTFIVVVNLFGVIMFGTKTAQGAVSNQTNPQLKIAAGFFDALDENAPRYVTTGKELFGPTLEQLNGKSDEQPAVLLIENGQKIVKQASVFKSIAGMFKQVNFIFGILPIVLLGVTLLLFILAIKPTLLEIIKLPATVAAGAASAGQDVVKRAMRRVGGEVIATVCALGVLVVLTFISGFVMGVVVKPALDALITCFARAVDYLQFVNGASTGMVALMLFGVILFLVLNLAVVILSMSFFMGKTQKVFQQRFNEGVPLSAHQRWWTWALPAVFVAQLLPLLYVFIARFGIQAIERKIMASATAAEKVNWSMLLLSTPLLLVIGFGVFFWAARGVKAVAFLQKYKVKLTPAPAPAAPAA
jgi:hypothetical protein